MSLLYPAETQSENQKSNANFLKENSLNWDEIEQDGWHLPGTKPEHSWCGTWSYKGCLEIMAHCHSETFKNKGYLKTFQKSCFRADCETCHIRWNHRASSKGTRRIEKYEKISHRESKHIVISVPKWDYGKSKKDLAKKAREILDKIHCIGGAMIFHPFRNKKIDNHFRWYYSPHFHVIGFGWILPTVDTAKQREGWIVKNKGHRRTVFGTFCYLLSHAGIKRHNHALTWFGDLSYSNLELREEDFQGEKCPICENKLQQIRLKNEIIFKPPEMDIELAIDPTNWEYVVNEEYYQQPGIKLPYSNSGGFEEEKPERKKSKKSKKKPYRILSLKYWMKSKSKTISI